MNDSQRNSMIDRIQIEYDREKINGLPGPRPDVRATLLLVEVLVEIDRSLHALLYTALEGDQNA